MVSDIHPVNLGIIGTGSAAKYLHLPAIRKLGDRYRIVAVCNRSEEKGRAFAGEVSNGRIDFYTDYRDLLALPYVEAVDIALPIELNFPTAMESLEAGKHVILEKPPAASTEDARKLSAFKELHPSLVLLVAENFRYFPVLLRIRELLAEQAIGIPFAVNWQVLTRIELSDRHAQSPWRIDHKYPGGFITDVGVHYIAGLRLILGKFISGFAHTQSINPLIGELDTLDFQFLIRNETCPDGPLSLRNRTSPSSIRNYGDQLSLGLGRNWEQGAIKYQTGIPSDHDHTGVNLVQGTLQLYLSVYGITRDILTIFGEQGTIIAHTGMKDHILILKRPGMPTVVEKPGEDRGYRGEFENFYEAIRSGEPVLSTVDESCRDLEIILKVQEGAGRREKIDFA